MSPLAAHRPMPHPHRARRPIARWCGLAPLAALLLVAARPAPAATVDELVARGDRAHARRAEGAQGDRARSQPIGEAVVAFREALAQAPERLDVRVRLLRSLFFLARYATEDPKEQKRLYEEGRSVFDQGLERLGRRAGARLDKADAGELPALLAEVPEAGELYFWGAVHWGLWGESFGTMASVRKGVAGKIRRFGEGARALAPEYENAGAYRLLGRLHALAPKVPLFTGWVDHDLAIEYLERAVELAPEDPLNRFFLAEALYEYGTGGQGPRVRELLESAANAQPRPDRRVEDGEAIADARARLATLTSG
jgi:tetratricopeptide (TPR) repeat protein